MTENNRKSHYRFPMLMAPMTFAVMIAEWLLQINKQPLTMTKLLFLKVLTFIILWLGFMLFIVFYYSFEEFFYEGLLKKLIFLSILTSFYFFIGYDRFTKL